jgi:thioredoxin-dependent peroxiredoxin
MFSIRKLSAVAMFMAVPFVVQAQTTATPATAPAPAAAAKPAATPTPATAATAATPAPAAVPAAPQMGAVAPDFTAQGANMSGVQSVSLGSLRGQVVVLAFYPLDRSTGCTHEMEKFRDEFATIFGSGVTVLPISEDSVGSHVSWAHDSHFPFTLVSDKGGAIATSYGSMMPGRPYASRTVFVIGKDGKVAYSNMKFGALDQHAYDALTAAVAKAKAE